MISVIIYVSVSISVFAWCFPSSIIYSRIVRKERGLDRCGHQRRVGAPWLWLGLQRESLQSAAACVGRLWLEQPAGTISRNCRPQKRRCQNKLRLRWVVETSSTARSSERCGRLVCRFLQHLLRSCQKRVRLAAASAGRHDVSDTHRKRPEQREVCVAGWELREWSRTPVIKSLAPSHMSACWEMSSFPDVSSTAAQECRDRSTASTSVWLFLKPGRLKKIKHVY